MENIDQLCECGHRFGNHKVYNDHECGAEGCHCGRFAAPDAAMPKDAEAHLERIKREFCQRVDAKYRKGQIEHGGQLWRKPRMLDQAIAEVLDLAVYLLTLKEQELNPSQVSEALGEDLRP